jgi:uncharacterized membrane protein YciS (DUF1049 family)
VVVVASFDIASTLGKLGSGSLNTLLIVVVIIVVAGLLGAFYFLYQRNKRYQEYTCIVWFRDGFGQLSQLHDGAGVFIDRRTRNKRFFMRKANVGLSPDNIPFVNGPDGKKYVYLYRNGLKNFYFLKPQVSMDGVNIKVGEEDVNWAVNDYIVTKEMFTLSSLLQYLPYISLAIVSIIIMVVFIYFFKNFDVLREASVNLKEAALALRDLQSNTTIIPT